MEDLSIQYFRDLLDKHVKELRDFCREWEETTTDISIPEAVVDEVRTTVGLTNLLLRQKLKQFGGLIDDSELKRGEKEITCVDLQGFWDMVFNEVEKIQKSFQKLEKCRSNNWVFVEEPVLKMEVKKKPTIPAIAKVTVQSKAHTNAARQRIAEAKQRMMEAKKKMKESKNDAKEDFVIMELKPSENVVANKKTTEPEEQLKPVLLTIEDKNKMSKKTTPKSNKKAARTEEVTGQQKRQKSERISKGKENLLESGKKPELLTASAEKVSRSKRPKSPREADVPPSQIVTRSVTRALLAKQ